jgi:hypothetical protein
MIPNVLHFVFGMVADFGGMPFGLVHYLSIKSAIVINNPDTVYFHYQYEPEGEWWLKAKDLLTLNKITAPKSFMGNDLCHMAHRADVVRLQALKETGGIYLDTDTISVRPLTDLLQNSFVIGQELKAVFTPKNFRQRAKHSVRKQFGFLKEMAPGSTGLCNAVLLSEKNGAFVSRWLDEYKTFRSLGRDKYWNEHSVQTPQKLAEQNQESIIKLNPYAFHYPLYDGPGLKLMFEEVCEFPEAYLHHLWESFSWNKYLSKLTPEEIKTKDTTYNLIARRFL